MYRILKRSNARALPHLRFSDICFSLLVMQHSLASLSSCPGSKNFPTSNLSCLGGKGVKNKYFLACGMRNDVIIPVQMID